MPYIKSNIRVDVIVDISCGGTVRVKSLFEIPVKDGLGNNSTIFYNIAEVDDTGQEIKYHSIADVIANQFRDIAVEVQRHVKKG